MADGLSYCDCCWEVKQEKVPAKHLMEWGEELCSDCMEQAVAEEDDRDFAYGGNYQRIA